MALSVLCLHVAVKLRAASRARQRQRDSRCRYCHVLDMYLMNAGIEGRWRDVTYCLNIVTALQLLTSVAFRLQYIAKLRKYYQKWYKCNVARQDPSKNFVIVRIY